MVDMHELLRYGRDRGCAVEAEDSQLRNFWEQVNYDGDDELRCA